MRRLALAALAALLTACSAGVGGDWPGQPKGVLADCKAPGDRCGGSGWCGATEDDRLTCCPVPLRDGVYCPGTDPAVVECEVDADCPREDCREAPRCMGGVCFAAIVQLPNTCSTGICSAVGTCLPCDSDAACVAGASRSPSNECVEFSCNQDGSCSAVPKQVNDACNFTDVGTCGANGMCGTD